MTQKDIPTTKHPFLYFDADVEGIRQRIYTEPEYHEGFETMRKKAAEAFETPLVSEASCSEGAGQHADYGAAVKSVKQVESLGFVYQITGDARYAERTREILLHYAAFKQWTGPAFGTWAPPWHAALETAEFCLSYALGYDWVYDVLSKKERSIIAKALAQKGIQPILADWLEPATRIHAMDSMGHNWWSVCVGGAGVGALVLIGDDPRAEGWAQMVADAYPAFFNYWGNAFFNKPSTFGGDGGFYESLTYGLYTLHGFFHFADAWKRVTGDETLLPIPQLCGMAEQLIHCFYPGKDGPLAVNFGDSGDVADHPEVLAYLAHVLNDPHAQWFYRQHCPSLTTPQQMVWHRGDVPARPPDDLPACRLFKDIGWGMLRTGWSQENALLAVKCGDTWNHAHADAGHFTLYAYGQPLVIDPGTCDYDLPEYRDYYTRNIAHNVVLLDGQGQQSEQAYHGVRHRGHLDHLIDTPCYKTLVADGSGPFAQLYARYFRHFILLEDGTVVLIDDLLSHRGAAYHIQRSKELSNSQESHPQINETWAGEQYEWLLHGAQPMMGKGNTAWLADGEVGLQVTMVTPEGLRIEERTGYKEKTKESLPYLAFVAPRCKGAIKFLVILTPYRLADASDLPALTRIEGENWIGVVINREPLTKIHCNLQADGRVMHENSNNDLGGWETDAFIFSQLGEETPLPKLYALHNASYLRRDQQVFFDSLVKAFAVVWQDSQGCQATIQTQPNVRVRMFVPQRPGEVWVNEVRAEDWTYEEVIKLVTFRLPCEENVVRVCWEV